MDEGAGLLTQLYAIGIGSNRSHGRLGRPEAVVRAVLAMLPGEVVAMSPTIASAPIGPSLRRYANSAALIETELDPPALLTQLKAIERALGRRRSRRWGARVIDLDIILWSGGIWASPGLSIPHPGFRERSFVLKPLSRIAADWRDPVTGLSIRQLNARLDRAGPSRLGRRRTQSGALSSVGRATDF